MPPTPTSELQAAMSLETEYLDEVSGVSLQHPDGWVTSSFLGMTFITESQEALEAIMAGETPEMIIALFSGSFDQFGFDSTALDGPADLFHMEGFSPVGSGDALDADWEMGEIAELEIDGYPAAQVEFTSDMGTDDKVNGYAVAVIMEDMERATLFIGGTTPERWKEVAPTIKAIAHSMTFSEPRVTEFAIGEVELTAEPFVDEAMGYSIAYPEGWQSMDISALLGMESGSATAFVQDLATLVSGVPTAVIVMADTLENFLDGALVGITADHLEAVLTSAAGQMTGELGMEMGEVESLVVGDLAGIGAELTGTNDDGDPTAGYLTVVLDDTHAAMVMTVMPVSQWQAFEPTFFTMLDTFTFTGGPAHPVSPTGTAVPRTAGRIRANPILLGEIGSAAQWDIQVMEVLRGNEARGALLAASEWNDPPPDGFEYIVVRIAVERTGDSEAKEIGSVDFGLTGSEAVLYETPWLTNPDPELEVELLPGGTAEGWLSFIAQEGEKDLLLVYDEAWEWDDEPLYFALEEGAAVPMPDGLISDGDAKAGTSRTQPASVGVKIFEIPWEAQVLEVIRGDEAYEAIVQANKLNDPPREGLEYMLLQIYVRNLDKVEKAQEIDGSMFHVTGDNNVLYRYPWIVEPEPELEARLYPGGEWTGWLAQEFGIGEKNPILVFGDVFDLAEKGRYLALEEGAAVPFPASITVTGDPEAGRSLDDPAPFDTVIATEQWEFTILDVLRGDKAWDALYEANENNDPPEEGMEYILVRARLRNISNDDEAKRCDDALFDIVGQNRESYEKPFLTVPEPELGAWLYPNGETEGWAVLQVAEGKGGLILIVSDAYFSPNKRYLLLEE
jgi:hypothetical protein